jgi:hypothetical protein
VNRRGLRGAKAQSRAVINAAPSPDLVVRYLLAQMMEQGKAINDDVETRVGGVPTSGHVVDVLMTSSADFERAVLEGRFGDAMNDAVRVLFLARDLAIREGKIRLAKVANA